jgi:hypothetical protein
MMSEINIILYTASMVIFGIAALIIFEKYDDDK